MDFPRVGEGPPDVTRPTVRPPRAIGYSARAIPGMRCVMPQGTFYAMPQVELPPGASDQDFVLGLLRETGILVVYGSGFGADPAWGSFRVVFLAPPAELGRIYDDIGAFTARFRAAA